MDNIKKHLIIYGKINNIFPCDVMVTWLIVNQFFQIRVLAGEFAEHRRYKYGCRSLWGQGKLIGSNPWTEITSVGKVNPYRTCIKQYSEGSFGEIAEHCVSSLHLYVTSGSFTDWTAWIKMSIKCREIREMGLRKTHLSGKFNKSYG